VEQRATIAEQQKQIKALAQALNDQVAKIRAVREEIKAMHPVARLVVSD
jgi:hypothetical protein